MTTGNHALFDYLLRLADSDLVLAQRLGEWTGKGPVLEEDIALTNVGLDLIGQARLWYAYAAEVEGRYAGAVRTEDALAFLRDGHDYRNLQLVEQPNGSYADTTARQFYFDTWHLRMLHALTKSRGILFINRPRAAEGPSRFYLVGTPVERPHSAVQRPAIG